MAPTSRRQRREAGRATSTAETTMRHGSSGMRQINLFGTQVKQSR
jgi:hypothetical protein